MPFMYRFLISRIYSQFNPVYAIIFSTGFTLAFRQQQGLHLKAFVQRYETLRLF